jgi:phosphoglucomutase
MSTSVIPGQPAPPEILINVEQLLAAFTRRPPVPVGELTREGKTVPKFVSFGTSGHRGSPLDGTFNRDHILAITQAICEYRYRHGHTGPLFLGRDTHAASAPAEAAVLEVLAANSVTVCRQADHLAVPTPAVSRAILRHNAGRTTGLADGIIITPSHNPPRDGGLKYNPPNGGPADTAVTNWIEHRANELLLAGNAGVRRVPHQASLHAPTTHAVDFIEPYVAELDLALNLEPVRAAGLKLGVDPLGGASLPYWERIAARYGLNLEVVNRRLDPAFGFMTVDHDGLIRMDCSSPFAMAGLLALKDRFDIAWGCDPDADRHGIVTRLASLLNPNHYLCVAIDYLLTHRPNWPATAAVGKTLVSSSLIDRVVRHRRRALSEVPVGFKWFVDGLHSGWLCFGGEESAGASFLCRNGAVWTTDKDGLLLGLLAAEITAVTGREPGRYYQDLTRAHCETFYRRVDADVTPAEKAAFARLEAGHVKATTLAGDPIEQMLTRAPGNHAPIGGLKVVTGKGWFAARPSGTEPKLKLYAESLASPEHLEALLSGARELLRDALARAGR